jgi:putative hydrolase of the HAD superfamily
MTRARIQAVFLDVGGTLADPDPSFHEVIARVCQRSGLAVSAAEVARVEPLVWSELAALGLGYPLTAEESRRYWRTVYQAFGRHFGATDCAALAEEIARAFVDLRTWRLYPDAGDALPALRARGYRLVAVSNWEAWLEELLEHLGVLGYFDAVVSSTRAGVAKPDPRLFRAALDLVGLEPAEVVHVGDSPTHDAAPAAAAGIRPVLVDRQDRYSDFPGLRLPDLRPLPDLLDRDLRQSSG